MNLNEAKEIAQEYVRNLNNTELELCENIYDHKYVFEFKYNAKR